MTSAGAYNYHLDYTADYSFETFISVFLPDRIISSTLDYSRDDTPSYVSAATIHTINSSAYIVKSYVSGTTWSNNLSRANYNLYNSTICKTKFTNYPTKITARNSSLFNCTIISSAYGKTLTLVNCCLTGV